MGTVMTRPTQATAAAVAAAAAPALTLDCAEREKEPKLESGMKAGQPI